MENIIKKLKNGAKHTRLSATEKAEMKGALLRHMRANPAIIQSSVLSPFFIQNFRNKKATSVFVIASILLGGSISFAAENAVPGDVLFPVKVQVNENMRGFVAVTSKAKAEWEVHLVERRLEEVEKLAVIPNVSPAVQQIADQNLEQYSKRVKNRIEKFEKDDDGKDAMETASSLSGVYGAHEQVLLSLNTSSDVAVSETATTTALVSITTQVVQFPSTNNESIKGALKRVHDARGEVEKKHEALKEKYERGGSQFDAVLPTSGKTLDTKDTQSARESKGRKNEIYKVEEIRASIINEEETKKKESIKRENPRLDKMEKSEESY